VYRSYVISQVLDGVSDLEDPAADLPGRRTAEVLSCYGLTGEGSGNWTQLYEHTGGVVAAAVTIARRMRLSAADMEMTRAAAFLHDATKRQDVERNGELSSSLKNTDFSLERTMRRAGYSAGTIAAAMNTGRADRIFSSARARCQSIQDKGVVAAIVGLADTRSLGANFVTLDDALADYLGRKRDAESVEFFTRHWEPYYRAVEEYLIGQSPGLDLQMTVEDIYHETVFTDVFGPEPSRQLKERYAFR